MHKILAPLALHLILVQQEYRYRFGNHPYPPGLLCCPCVSSPAFCTKQIAYRDFMQLRQINKQQYRSHLNVIMISSIALFSAMGVGFSTILIYFFGKAPGENFYLNLTGVATAGLIAAVVLKKLKHTRYFDEVAYVWDLKYELNLIHRKFRQIQKAAAQNDHTAAICMLYHYEGSRQLWLLDDNVLNLQELETEFSQFEQKIRQAGLNVSASDYRRHMLEHF